MALGASRRTGPPCLSVCLSARIADLHGNTLKLDYATVQLLLGYVKRQDGGGQGREGRPKARGDGIVVGLDKARHVKMVGREGDCC